MFCIKQAVQQSPAYPLDEFRRWFAQFGEVVWDAPIDADAGAGKPDVSAEYHKGTVL